MLELQGAQARLQASEAWSAQLQQQLSGTQNAQQEQHHGGGALDGAAGAEAGDTQNEVNQLQ